MTAKEQLIITDNSLNEYRKILQNEEKKTSTIEKYIRDVKKLRDFAKGQPITQELLINYKQHPLVVKVVVSKTLKLLLHSFRLSDDTPYLP